MPKGILTYLEFGPTPKIAGIHTEPGWFIRKALGRGSDIARVHRFGDQTAAEQEAYARLFKAAPRLLAAVERWLEEIPFVCDADSCECRDGNGRDDAGNVCEHIQACRARDEARGTVSAPPAGG